MTHMHGESCNGTVFGTCPFNYHYPEVQQLYITLPNDTSQLNSFMCGDLNRTGLLCSKCQHALGPAVFSYRPQCVACLDGWYEWLVYTLFLWAAGFDASLGLRSIVINLEEEGVGH